MVQCHHMANDNHSQKAQQTIHQSNVYQHCFVQIHRQQTDAGSYHCPNHVHCHNTVCKSWATNGTQKCQKSTNTQYNHTNFNTAFDPLHHVLSSKRLNCLTNTDSDISSVNAISKACITYLFSSKATVYVPGVNVILFANVTLATSVFKSVSKETKPGSASKPGDNIIRITAKFDFITSQINTHAYFM